MAVVLRILGRVAKGLGFLLLGLVLVLLLAFGAVQTGPGKAALASIASSLASTEGLTVTISGIEGFVPSRMGVQRIAVADVDGPFAEVEGLRLDWSPLALLGGTISVERVEAARLALMRQPILPQEAATEEAPAGGASLLPFRIGRLAIGEIDVAEPVIGHAATLSLDASADLVSLAKGLSVDLKIERRDAPGSIGGTLRYLPDTGVLDVDLAAQEPAGGLVARAAGLDGLPAVSATLKGKGPLDAWDAHLSVAAGDTARVEGAASLRRVAESYGVKLALDADISRLLPADLAPLFEQRTEIAGSGTVDDTLAVAIDTLTVRAAGFGAALRGRIGPADQNIALSYDLRAGTPDRFAGLAPGVGWSSLTFGGSATGTIAAPAVDATLKAADLAGAGYGAGTLDAKITTRPDARGNLAIALSGTADGLRADDPKVAAALGSSARFTLSGTRAADAAPEVTAATVALAPLALRFAGHAGADQVNGTLNLERLDLAAFGPLAGRPLAGQAQLNAQVQAGDAFKTINLNFKGNTTKISTGIATVDGLLGGTTALSGALQRKADGAVAVDKLTIAGGGLDLAVNGRIDPSMADLTAKLALDDLAKLDPRVSGRLEGEAAFTGTLERLGLTAKLSVPSGKAMGQALDNIGLDVTATDITGQPGGRFKLSGRIAGKPATGSGTLASLAGGARSLDGLDIAIGSVSAKGAVSLAPAGTVVGRLAVAANDLSDLSAIALTPLTGRLNADVTLDAPDGRQRIAVKASADKVSAAGQSLDTARIDATVTDPTGNLVLDGTAQLAGLNAGGVTVARLTLDADGTPAGTALKLDALAQGATVTAAAQLAIKDATTALRLDMLRIARGGNSLATIAPANLVLADGTVSIDKLALAARGGSATISGKAGQQLDLDVDLRSLPLALAALAAPDQGLTGTLSGSAKISGPAKAPTGSYDLSVARLSMPDLARSGVGPLDITARGNLSGGRVGIEARISGPSLSGVSISGSAPLAAGDLDLALRGTVALAIINPLLADSGARLTGNAVLDATVKGTPAAPRAGGTIRISGARFDDVVNGVTLDRIEGTLTGTERSVTVSALTARTQNGGTLQARGNVGLDPAAGFPGRVEITMQNAGLISSELMRLVTEGNIAVEGAFARNPKLTGRVLVKSLDVNIPDRLPGGAAALDVRHVNVRGTRKPAAIKPKPKPPAASANAGIPLDLTVSAPNGVFVRGMGMEAELGGDLTVRGTSTAPQTVGAFEMRRGRFDIIGKRFTFTRGKITFSGSTDPDLDFVAETTSNDITARILVTGPASEPEIAFTSSPTLPQDEVLARLLFGRSAGSLTAGQTLQVAQTIAQFSGGGPGVLDNVRRSLGVDSLDVGTNDAGTGGQIGIGKRLNDKIYLGVKQGTTPNSSKVTVDIDITKNIRLQGATGADGSSEVGIGAQWDY